MKRKRIRKHSRYNPKRKRVPQLFALPPRIVEFLDALPYGKKTEAVIYALRKTYDLDNTIFKDLDLSDP